MRKTNIIMSIDPDVDKSGVAVLHKSTKKIELFSLRFPELVDFLKDYKREFVDLIVVVEAGWLNSKSNFHTEDFRKGQRVAKNVGSNHQTGKHIAEMAEHFGLTVELQKPLVKCWKGKDGKITHDEITYFTGYTGSTNAETRDALLIAWNYANLPIRVKV